MSENLASAPVHAAMEARIKPAPIFKRIFAYIIDLGIASIPMYLLLYGSIVLGAFLLVALERLFNQFREVAVLAAIIWFVVVAIIGLVALDTYFVYFEYKRGATLGKKIMGLRVISLNGSKLTLKQCVLRDLARLVDCLLVLPGLISILISKKSQRLGDMMVGTLVVHSEHQEKASRHLYIEREKFLEMKDLYEIQEIPKDLLLSFKKYCFHRFIKQSSIYNQEEEQYWVLTLSEFVKRRLDSSLPNLAQIYAHSDEQFLRFCAESITIVGLH